jgi:hypothetical protein
MPTWLPWRFLSGLACGAFVVYLWHDAVVSRISHKQAEERLTSAFSVIAANKSDEAIAYSLERVLTDLRLSQRTIIREREKIVERPVYLATCLDFDGVQLANDAKNGRVTSKPDAAVPDSK